ncbi:Neisseria PilC domain protein [Crenothrix polyspora]|uniref:Neisseria PilC domain protein n=2 Tax=Crenothrix polyspora TaxID=360316 RepID=A0A1R4HCB3_9GAMM|nr:Neisseria PilC domain protein [Crenothrix polyspora]
MNSFIVSLFSILKNGLIALLLSLLLLPKVFAALNIAQTPLFLTPSASPLVMLSMPKDHQLYIKAFDDYSDLDGDGIIETTYKHDFNYYGYFDSYRCYDYVSNHFEPSSITVSKYCTGRWSGNFLNWASMTRIDNVRKLLYGGLRASDTDTETLLERSYLPNDAHSFAKFYDGLDLDRLTPFSEPLGITLCNTTVSKSTFSQDVTDPPLLRVAAGNYNLWAANERWQCLWTEEEAAGDKRVWDFALNKLGPVGNGNPNPESEILDSIHDAKATNPSKAGNGVDNGNSDFIVRVNACVDDGLQDAEHCKSYYNARTGKRTLKPVGLLQTYGDNGHVHFGLMTGSYGNNKSGGILRKNVSAVTDEINVDTDGTFKAAPSTGGIINTLNKLRIYGYRHSGGTLATNGTYANQPQMPGDDNCPWGLDIFKNGQCSNWGNPQAEIFLESLRYLAGKKASPAFVTETNDSDRISGLTGASATDPLINKDYCASLNVMHFNGSNSSYDADGLISATDIRITDVNSLIDTVGNNADINGKRFFVGAVTAKDNRLCTAKTITALSKVRGLCPEEPRLDGSYALSGLAHYGHITDMRPNKTILNAQKITTYGVALSHHKPAVVINVPDSTQKITLLPACRNTEVNGNCTLVDFKIVKQTNTAGKLYVNWEDSEQGGDFDQDMWGIINYRISANTITNRIRTNTITISTDVIGQSTIYPMGFGYIISGTNDDGFHSHSGINKFTDAEALCTPCLVTDPAKSKPYTITGDSADFLQTPLFYAAQWGGFNDSNDNDKPDQQSEWDSINNATGLPPGDGIPDQYFSAIQPKRTEAALDNISTEITRTTGSSAPVTSNSFGINSNTVLYQAKFNSTDWTGQLWAYTVATDNIATIAQWDAGLALSAQKNRAIFSYNPMLQQNKGIDFIYEQLNADQQSLLTQAQLRYIRGEAIDGLRTRTSVLGDIINSAPLFIGPVNNGYRVLPNTEGSDYSNYIGSSAMLNRTPMLAIGANDGMLHVFDAALAHNGKELFAYIPNTVMGNLAALTSPSYTTAGQHKYFVDGSAAVGDAYFDVDHDNHKEWRTILVGTLGAGGKGVFALDMSFLSPADQTYKTPEPDFSTQRILWEINDHSTPFEDNLTDKLTSTPKQYGYTHYLGYTLGQASVIRLANGQFAAIFGNGYNSQSETAVLYIVNIQDGRLIRSINTHASGDNGLSTPLAVDVNNDGITDAIYAGDLQGNLWKFDVSTSNPDNWDVAYTNNNAPAPLFTAKIDNQPRQPITIKPAYGVQTANGGISLFFGAGSYFQTSDNKIDTAPTQSFYGIWDECVNYIGIPKNCTSNPVNGRSALVAQTIDDEFLENQLAIRKTSSNTVSYPSQKGWYMDLIKPPQPGNSLGERVVSQAVLRNHSIIFITNIPNDQSCKTEGGAWLMELNPLTGGRLSQTPFDISGDNQIDTKDQIKDNDKVSLIAASGYHVDMNTVSITPGFNTVTNKNGNNLKIIVKKLKTTGRRQSWAQLR